MFEYPIYCGNYLDQMGKSKYQQWLEYYRLVKHHH